jgi:hypothetical protein
MNTTKQARAKRLLPAGVPRYVRCYDNGGEPADRYTVVYTRVNHRGQRPSYPYVGMSAAPFHPQGFGQHGESANAPVDSLNGKWPPSIGRKNHLGTRIRFHDLPEDCRKLVLADYKELWNL